MHSGSDSPQRPSEPHSPVAPRQANPLRNWPARLADLLLQIEPFWTFLAASLVFAFCLIDVGPVLPWVALALAFLPFPLRLLRTGTLRWRTPFDIPVALFMTGAIVGLCVSPDRTISLAPFQCIIAFTLLYYSLVHSPLVTRLIKGTVVSLAVGFLLVTAVYLIIVSVVEGKPNLDILGSGTHHGIAMYLAAEAAILLGIAGFGKGKRTRLVAAALFIILLGIILSMTWQSLGSVFHGRSTGGRWPIWEKTVDLLSESPVTGLGLGGWAVTYWGTTILDTPVVNGITHAHNAYLELYANAGVIGVLALLAALGIGARFSLDIIRSPRDRPWYGFGVGVILACVATLLVGIFESAPMGVPLVAADTYRYMVSPIAWLLLGLLAVSHRLTVKSPGS